jgi:hypothetical protein
LAAGGETGTRLRVIEEALADRDAVLDLHETSCDTEPLAVCADTSRHVDAVSRLGLSTIVAGASEVLGEGMLAAWVDQQGGCGVTVEVGRNGTSEAAAQAAQLAFRWLKGDASQAASSVQVWRLRGVIRALEDGTQAVRGFGNASRVSEREVVARGPTSMVRAPGNGALFLPKAQADHGRPVALFATDDGQRVPSRQRSDD